MEYMQEDKQYRAEVIEQLKKRELFVPNAENLPTHQLQHIYNGFIVPHPRRERQHFVSEMPPKCVNEMPMEMQQVMQRIRAFCLAGQKRCPSSDIEPEQHQQLLELSCSASKRIRIDQQP